MADLQLFDDVIAEIAARLDLRDPNRDAVQTLAAEVSQHYDVDEKQPPFEAVIDSATGVGKTYVLAGAMEFLAAAYEVRDFVVVTPGRTILEKTKANFTPGHPKSLLGPMSFQPVVITAENFATPAMRAAMDDRSLIKIYLFTVQSLIRPESKTGRKTHKFQEGLGTEFYAYLKSSDQLVVIADEHHTYYGSAFSKAVRDLDPWVLVGLTATPHKQTPKDQIIFRYPLAAAIADKLVKTPVIVGRKDDRTDSLTKLADGITLLRAKEQAVSAYTRAIKTPLVNPVMLVVAKSIEDAEEYGGILRSEEFFQGAYADSVLVVHSNTPDVALAELAKVEEPDSSVRIIISVGMLKEGWDVSNVYVIASMRSSVSEILTEQTLGRGMRLPFGRYTEVEILDTLEVISHERYQDLLKKAGVLNEAFVDYRTRAVLRTNAQGQKVAVTEQVTSSTSLILADNLDAPLSLPNYAVSRPVVTTTEQRAAQADAAVASLKQQIVRRDDLRDIQVPILKMTQVKSHFSLSDITDGDAFRKLGTSLSTDPEGELSRTLVSARVVTGPDGLKRTEMVTSTAADRVRSNPRLFPKEDLRAGLAEAVLASPAVPARRNERAALAPLLDAFFDGLGDKTVSVLSANLDRASARLIRLVEQEQRRFMAKPSFEEVVEVQQFAPTRVTDKPVSGDRFGTFAKSSAYEDWKRSVFPVEWFDSRPERTVANMVDGDDHVVCWVRLHIKELPILWTSGGQEYNPDLIVVESDGTHWVVEVKQDKEMNAPDVQGKREAATRWANHVSADAAVGVHWRYLLVSESDVETARGSWRALKQLGQQSLLRGLGDSSVNSSASHRPTKRRVQFDDAYGAFQFGTHLRGPFATVQYAAIVRQCRFGRTAAMLKMQLYDLICTFRSSARISGLDGILHMPHAVA
jgi:type III restriction enzyme